MSSASLRVAEQWASARPVRAPAPRRTAARDHHAKPPAAQQLDPSSQEFV